MTVINTALDTLKRPQPRRMDFVFDDSIPMDWFGGDPFKTMVLTALSGTFPEGERFFVDSVRHYQKNLKPALAAQVCVVPPGPGSAPELAVTGGIGGTATFTDPSSFEKAFYRVEFTP